MGDFKEYGEPSIIMDYPGDGIEPKWGVYVNAIVNANFVKNANFIQNINAGANANFIANFNKNLDT